jgi:hypothetical protein
VRVLKHTLNRCLWIAFAGTLKIALVLYIFSLPGTAAANAASKKEAKGVELPPVDWQKEMPHPHY